MLNQIYFANDTNWQSLIDAISNAGGDTGATFDFVEINRSDFSWNANAYAYYADIPTGINVADIIGILSNVNDSVIGSSGSIYDGKIYIQLFSPYNSYKGDGNDDFTCNLVVKNSSGGGIDFTGIIDALDDIYAGVGTVSGDLSNIYNAIGDIETQMTDIVINNNQWSNLLNAIANQQITVDMSNVNTDNTENMSSFVGTSVTNVLNLIYNALFTTDTNIIKWDVVTNYSQFDIYLFKIGIIKFLWIDTAKSQINSGWQSGGVGNLPTGYESILNPAVSDTKSLRNGTQITITVNSLGNLNINPSATISNGYPIRVLFIYI